MKSKQITLTLQTPALDNVCADQQAVGAGDFTIDGSLASGGAVSIATAQRLDIESAGNVSTVTFTITGTDEDGNAQTEAITGPNATTVTSTSYFKTITQVAVDGAVGTDTSIGITDEALSQTIVMDYRNPDFRSQVAVNISGTINYDVEKCFEDPFDTTLTRNWYNSTDVAGSTADDRFTTDADLHDIYTAMRIVVNTYSGGATCVGTILGQI